VKKWIHEQLPFLFGTIVSFVALLWALRGAAGGTGMFDVVGFACAIICLSSLFVYFLSSLWLSLARNQEWSPAYCMRQGFYLGIYLVFMFHAFGHSPRWLSLLLGLILGVTSGQVLRRRAFSTLADEQNYAAKKLPSVLKP
jgi:hypothetical protein